MPLLPTNFYGNSKGVPSFNRTAYLRISELQTDRLQDYRAKITSLTSPLLKIQ